MQECLPNILITPKMAVTWWKAGKRGNKINHPCSVPVLKVVFGERLHSLQTFYHIVSQTVAAECYLYISAGVRVWDKVPDSHNRFCTTRWHIFFCIVQFVSFQILLISFIHNYFRSFAFASIVCCVLVLIGCHVCLYLSFL